MHEKKRGVKAASDVEEGSSVDDEKIDKTTCSLLRGGGGIVNGRVDEQRRRWHLRSAAMRHICNHLATRSVARTAKGF